jgi:hypothetical protein
MDPAELLAHLRDTAAPAQDVRAPASPGVYAWFLDDPGAIVALPDQIADPIYVGISDNLARRGDENHFRTGGSGFSTLRRSIGALLKDELTLSAQPRSPGVSEQNYRCYRFDDLGEQRLTDWMRVHLRVGVARHPDPARVEPELIALARPPLNLTGWRNPFAPELKALRKRCADEARRACPRPL